MTEIEKLREENSKPIFMKSTEPINTDILGVLTKSVMEHDKKILNLEGRCSGLLDGQLRHDWACLKSNAVANFIDKDRLEIFGKIGGLNGKISNLERENKNLKEEVKKLSRNFMILSASTLVVAIVAIFI